MGSAATLVVHLGIIGYSWHRGLWFPFGMESLVVGLAVVNWRKARYFDCSYRGLLVLAFYLIMLALVIVRPLPAAGALCFFVGFGNKRR